jgi:hypothetical protein
MTRLLQLLICAALVSTIAPAHADDAADKATAQALFDEGMRLFDAGDHASACTKFEAAASLLPKAIGVRGKLAECYEAVGKTASAWAAYREVAVLAGAAGQSDRESVAAERAQRLEPDLAYLTISVPEEAAVVGLVVARNGTALSAGALDTPIAVDPGTHEIVASAEGYEASSRTIDVAPKQRVALAIEPLVALPPPPEPEPQLGSDVEPMRGRSKMKVAGWIAIGAGTASVALGGYFGLRARSRWNEAFDDGHCDSNNVCDADGSRLTGQARDDASAANYFVISGVIAAAAGGVLWYLSARGDDESAERKTVRVTPSADSDGVGVVVWGAF